MKKLIKWLLLSIALIIMLVFAMAVTMYSGGRSGRGQAEGRQGIPRTSLQLLDSFDPLSHDYRVPL